MSIPQIALVVASARNGIIGVHNKLPWHLPSELRRFKELTSGHPVVMGRKTYESIGRALPDRDNIVLTQQSVIDNPDVHTANTLEEALALAERFAVNRGVSEIMVIGGGEIYEQTLPNAHKIYLTEVDMDADGDTVFPPLDPEIWRESDRELFKAGPNDNADFAVVTLERESVSAAVSA